MGFSNNYIFLLCFLFNIPNILIGQEVDLDYYLPEANYNTSITTPEEFLGFQVGEWHISHDKLYAYAQLLARESDRVQYTEYARTYERRPLLYLTISSPKNLSNLSKTKKAYQNIAQINEVSNIDLNSLPAVVYQGYSIHGNESSGANAAILIAYYLAAGDNEHIRNVLNDLVILLDPCMNPDGFHRFSTWVNSHKYTNKISDPSSREYNEPWPRGRTNHYWFDLNRDWLLLAHPESRGRIQTFHEWNPVVLTDHHEMGTNSSFFFQPGVPSRTNPLTPQINQDLTEEIGTFHAKALDSIGSDYFTKERFDDFYYGKGSTYPDVHGCIGILFEQASSRGHSKMSKNGIVSFPFTIRNQVVTSISTQKAAYTRKQELLEYKRNYFRKIKSEATDSKNQSYKIWDTDVSKLNAMMSILNQHQIITYESKHDDGFSFEVPLNQKQHRLIRSIFETVTEFQDSVFYDVSTWHFPSAFDVSYEKITNKSLQKQSTIVKFEHPKSNNVASHLGTFYFDWNQYNAPALLHDLMDLSYEVKLGSIKEQGESRDVLLVTPDKMTRNQLLETADKWEVQLDVYSEKLKNSDQIILPQGMAMIVGENVNSYDAGHTWFQSDYRWDIPISMIDKRQLQNCDLGKYDILLMVHGRYDDISHLNKKISDWIDQGGTLVCFKEAIEYPINNQWITFNSKKSNAMLLDEKSKEKRKTNAPGRVLGGSIYESNINKAHPLSLGYSKNTLTMFKKGTLFFELPKNKNAVAFTYTKTPRLSGYSNDEHIERAANSAAVVSFGKGDGKIITITDNPNFRGFWYAGSKLFANTLFMSQLIEEDQLIK